MPEEAEKQARKELKRLERMPEAAAEHSMLRTYLDWLIELPWSKLSDGRHRHRARRARILDEDHYGLEKVKRRILEYLAVRKLNPEGKSPILCFVGPPGVGKTSLGQSIARATGRKFVRAQPRRRARRGRDPRPSPHLHRRAAGQHHPGHPQGGHAQPGVHARRDGQARRRASTAIRPRRCSRCSIRSRTRPSATTTWRVPFDLSRGDVHRHRQRARLDPGAAARPHGGDRAAGLHRGREARDRPRYLVRRQLAANGLTAEQCRDHRRGAARASSRDYTREAGVRNLERQIGAVLPQRRRADRRRQRASACASTRRPARDPRRAELRERGRGAHQHPGRGDRPRLDAGRRRHPVHRGDRGCPAAAS